VDWTLTVLETAARVFGVLGRESRVHRGWAGLYPTTPDRHPIVDRLMDGLFAAVGFAGTGVMLAPARTGW
jgi:glycine/D-amino acid oxidase-like deaminating enzyme